MKALLSLFLFVQIFVACSQNKPSKGSEENQAGKIQQMDVSSIQIDTNWTTKLTKTNEEWKKILTPEQYHITREQGTERPFSSPYYNNHDKGVYVCLSCNNPLFSSDTKFNSGTGWPSYFATYSSKSLNVSMDNSGGMSRDELTCKRCDAHLGHVFNDGPKPTGLRYCIDGFATLFVPKASAKKLAKATFAAGCFWCEEKVFESVKGVNDVISGYAGGKKNNPTYEEVGNGTTGHAEAFEFEYDSSKIDYLSLLKVFFASQDPTQVNGQGPDQGSQYRSMIFYRNEMEKKIASDYIAQLNASGKYKSKIAAELVPFVKFWKAEDYHQDYIKNHPENPYVQNESIPRFNLTKSRVPEYFK